MADKVRMMGFAEQFLPIPLQVTCGECQKEFEMETFEFLCLLHNHGMPNVMGILTHLDYFKVNKYLRRTKKRMKKRFWKEVYDGAKLFYFSGL